MSVLIHLGGQIPSRQLAQSVADQAELIIAADSGYDSCLQNELIPDVITGDFDSVRSVPDSKSIRVIPSKEQTATDFEKALRLIPQDSARLDILGGTGLRADHFLTNLLIAANQPDHRAVVFHDDSQTIIRVTPECPYHATLPVGTIISLIPFCDCTGTSTKGLFWNLSNSDMGPARQLGQSNKVAQSNVAASVEHGCLFVVIHLLQ